MRIPKSAAVCTGLLAVLMVWSGATAATLTNLRDPEFRKTYGKYAPGGDCKREPLVIVSQSGLAFQVGGKVRRSASFEYASTFFGPDYRGISFAIFPFPISNDEPGHVLMYLNADEVAGRLKLEENLGPRERLSPFEAALVKASPLRRCG